MIKKLLIFGYFILILCSNSITTEASQFFTDNDSVVVVIDPGHGGENLGTIANPNFSEKDINLITANALIEELSKYPGVTIYTTRTEDVDLSLKERAEFAKSVNADFLFSLHYNASANHTLYGSEVWIPLSAPYHAPAYQFAYIQLQQMNEMGLFIRGIKTRMNDIGKDYYGLIREASARQIPSVIIEHCHVDEERDNTFCENTEMLQEFGRRDAIAIATFLNLQGAPQITPDLLSTLTKDTLISDTFLDETEPDICSISVENADYSTGKLTLIVNGIDYNTPLLYFDYSLDGGRTYSKRMDWPGSDALSGTYTKSFYLNLDIPANTKPCIILRAYNKFDIFKDSNILSNFEMFCPAQPLKDPSRYEFLNVYNKLHEDIISVDSNLYSSDTPYLFGYPLTLKRAILLFGFLILWLVCLISGICIITKVINKKR